MKKLRDDVESLLRGWDAYETSRGRKPVIDYDCYPQGPAPTPVENRAEVHDSLVALQVQAENDQDAWVLPRIEADLAYVRAMLGQRLPLSDYVQRTQGCGTVGWSSAYLDRRRSEAISALDELGIAWGSSTYEDLEDLEGRLSPQETAEEIRRQAEELEPAVRELGHTSAEFTLSVEEVRVDDYWAYWLDGSGDKARLRINLEHAQFTKVRARQLALHEILGHALQAASYYHRAVDEDVPWVRILSVHGPQQCMLEGLAQALPYFVTPNETGLITRSKLTHYLQLVRAELHRRINAGQPPGECISFARDLVPYWSGESIADALDDRANNTLLRSYLWSYPAGMDWFVQLAESDTEATDALFRAAYESPLKPADLVALWPDSPPFGQES